MTKRIKKSHPLLPVLLTFLGFVVLSAIVVWLLRGKDIILLNPKGYIANEQLKLLITCTLIMLEIAIPMLFFFYFFAWKYRESNTKATYDPKAGQDKIYSVAIWVFPIITMVLLVITLVPATHKLEPKKVIDGDEDPLIVQVVALRWKWLFIYPEQNIATVNYVQIPEHTPVQFELTADETPMSSFWIPHLGGMLYAMTEHVNRLNLKADTLGDFEGSAAEINGHGFAGMRFNTRVSTQKDFDTWVSEAAGSSLALDAAEYQKLLEPSENHPVTVFSNPDASLYGSILSKYGSSHGHAGETTEHDDGGHE